MDTKLHKIDFVFLYVAAKVFFSLSQASRLVFLVPYILFLSGKTITSSVTMQDTGWVRVFAVIAIQNQVSSFWKWTFFLFKRTVGPDHPIDSRC